MRIYFAGKIHTQISPWQRWGRALGPVLLPILALGAQELLWDHIHSHKFLFFYPAVMTSGWLAGRKGALISTLISGVSAYFFLMESNRLTSNLSHDEWIPLMVFVAIGLLISHYLNVEQRVITALDLKTKELEEANHARMSFLAHVSHEIRTPLNAILGYGQLLEKDSLTAQQRAMIQRIRSSGEYLLSILNKILDFKKMEANLLKLDPQPLDLRILLEEIVHTVQPSAEAKGIRVLLDCPEEGSLYFCIDGLRLQQILLNLCTNAVKFTDKGSVSLQARVLEEGDKTSLLLFEIKDTGIGISAEGLSVIFKPFMQADASIAGRFGGSGLGLSIVKQLVEMMGGRIGVESRVNHGTSFWMEIPFVKAKLPSVTQADSKSEKSQQQALLGLKVLAADDNPINLDLIEQIIAREGGSVTRAQNGREALDLLERISNEVDVVLLDLHMPVLDGLQTVRTIRQKPEWRNLPVLAYTAETTENHEVAESIDLFDGFIEKPIQYGPAIESLARYNPSQSGLEVQTGLNARPTVVEEVAFKTQPQLPPIIDSKRVDQLFGSDIRLFNSYIRQFQKIFANAERELDGALEGNHIELAADLLHNIRGAAANLGLDELASIATTLKSNLRQSQGDCDPRLLESFKNSLNEVMSLRAQDSGQPAAVDQIRGKTGVEGEILRLAVLLSENDLAALDCALDLQPEFAKRMSQTDHQTFNFELEGLEFEKGLKLLTQVYGKELDIRAKDRLKAEMA